MALVTKAEAARLAKVSRTTIYRKVSDGKLSETNGRIDTSELIRVFGEISEHGETDVPSDKAEHRVTGSERVLLRDQIDQLQGQIRDIKTERDKWRDQADQAMDMLRAEQENMKLLTHQGANNGQDTWRIIVAVIMVALLLGIIGILGAFS